MATDFYTRSGSPGTSSAGASNVMRAEFQSIENGFAKLAPLTGAGNRVLHVNAGGTAYTSTAGFTFDGTTLTVPALTVTAAVSVIDNVFSIKDNADTTKIAQFQCSGITTGTTRTYTLPNASDTLVVLDAVQTLTQKTLTSPTINGATVSGTFAGNLTMSGQVSFTEATAPIISAKIGPVAGQQHTVPAVASDTIALLAANQTLTNKSITTFSGAFTFNPAGSSATLSPTGAGTVTIAPSTAGTLNNMVIGGATPLAGTFTTVTVNSNLLPDADDGATIGSGTQGWSDLFLASTGVINWANGNAVLTHSAGILTVSTGDLRVTTAGTNTASAVTVGGTQTLTSKTLTTPSISSPTISDGTIISGNANGTLFNTIVTNLLAFGAATTLAFAAAASSTTWTGQAWTLTGANSTNNTTLAVTNTSNAAAASHSIVDVSVGGTTSTGDPQVRLTIPGGTSWYEGVDNSVSDSYIVGTGTAVGTNARWTLDTTGNATLAGTLTVSGNTVTTNTIVSAATTATVFNTVATTVNAFGAATTLTMGAGAAATATYSFTTAINLNSGAINSNQATVALLATPTTVNALAAATTITVGAAASGTTWTGQSFTLTGANSTNNTALAVTNTSNAAAASHSYVDVSVGGTTSTGDPHLRLTIPGGTSWYEGVDNSDSDKWILGTGTAVGTNPRLTVTTTGTLTVAENFIASGTGPHAIGGATSTSYQWRQTGTFTVGAGNGVQFYLDGSMTALANQSGYGMLIAPTINEASSGTHSLMVGLGVTPTFINDTATTTDFASLYVGGYTAPAGATNASSIKINAAPTNATNNYALWVDAGNARLDGSSLILSSGTTEIIANTADAADSGAIHICGGGAISASRGASVLMYGNEHANTGVLQLGAGDVANGIIRLFTRGTEQVRITETVSATRYITLTGSNGGDPSIGASAGSLAITSFLLANAGAQVVSSGLALDVSTTAAATTANIQNWHKATSGDNLFMSFYTEGGGGTLRGSIDFNRAGVLTRYNTTSDERLKVDRGIASKPLHLPHLRIHDFDWKETGNRSRGVFAQEAYDVFPDAISVGTNGGDLSKPWGASYSAYVPDLIVGWQDHERTIESLLAWKAKAGAAMAKAGITIN